MFWTDEKIKWYLVASEYTKYHDYMANEIKNILPKNETLIDFGCGLALLPLKLKDYFSKISCVDFDENVLKLLQNNIDNNGINNMNVVLSNFYNGELETILTPADNILFSHFGSIKDYLSVCGKFFKKRLIIIRNDSENKIVYNHKKDTIKDICEYLDLQKINYEVYRQSYEFGQPLKDDEEVRYYLEKWYGEDGKDLSSKVVNINFEYNGENYKKFYPKNKSTAIIVIKKEAFYEKY